jgi:hypothetical protein
MEQMRVGTVFDFLIAAYDIPIGFEQSINDRDHEDYRFAANEFVHVELNPDGSLKLYPGYKAPPNAHPINIDVRNKRLTDVLDIIVRQMKNYAWEINDGVDNIFPTTGRDERFARLLKMHIGKFGLTRGELVKDITNKIALLPEFDQFLSDTHLVFYGGSPRTGADFVLERQYGRPLIENMTFSDLTFRELLNRITKSKKGAWILNWKWVAANGEEVFDIDI